MKVGFTGTQSGMTRAQQVLVHDVLVKRVATEFHHGDCVGADAEAHGMAVRLGIPVIIHPPLNPVKRAFCKGATHVVKELEPKEYLERNHDIVDATDMLVAVPRDGTERRRSGTWATIRYARKLGREVIILWRR